MLNQLFLFSLTHCNEWSNCQLTGCDYGWVCHPEIVRCQHCSHICDHDDEILSHFCEIYCQSKLYGLKIIVAFLL